MFNGHYQINSRLLRINKYKKVCFWLSIFFLHRFWIFKRLISFQFEFIAKQSRFQTFFMVRNLLAEEIMSMFDSPILSVIPFIIGTTNRILIASISESETSHLTKKAIYSIKIIPNCANIILWNQVLSKHNFDLLLNGYMEAKTKIDIHTPIMNTMRHLVFIYF